MLQSELQVKSTHVCTVSTQQ